MKESSKSVFIVDDEPVISRTLAVILKQAGFNAFAFTRPADVLSESKSTPPDLLISDVMMPEMTGIELAIHVRAACPQCRILLSSGQAATAELLSNARKDGHDFELLTKPVHPGDLLARIRLGTLG